MSVLPFCHSDIMYMYMYMYAGINTVLVPIYLSELSPVRLRGSAGALHQVAITAALFLSQVLGFRMV